jgi:hypothetical protein
MAPQAKEPSQLRPTTGDEARSAIARASGDRNPGSGLEAIVAQAASTLIANTSVLARRIDLLESENALLRKTCTDLGQMYAHAKTELERRDRQDQARAASAEPVMKKR